MGWVTLTARKQSLRLAISDHQMRDIELSRKRRRMQRTSAYDIMVMQSNKSLELREIKNRLDALYSKATELKEEMITITDEIFNLELDILLRLQEKE